MIAKVLDMIFRRIPIALHGGQPDFGADSPTKDRHKHHQSNGHLPRLNQNPFRFPRRLWHISLLVSCSITETGDLTPLRGPLYETWFREAAACIGQEGRSPFEIELFSTPLLQRKDTGRDLYGVFRAPNTLIVVETHATNRKTVTHEMLHFLAAPDCHSQIPLSVWIRCTGVGYNAWDDNCAKATAP